MGEVEQISVTRQQQSAISGQQTCMDHIPLSPLETMHTHRELMRANKHILELGQRVNRGGGVLLI